jgi:phenylacetate-CoA ligase
VDARPWLDTRRDLERRASGWRAALESAGISSADRVLLCLPLTWAVGADAYLGLLELGALMMAADPVSPRDLVQFGPTVLVTTPTDALRLVPRADDGSQVQVLVVTGEPGGSLDVTRRTIEHRWGAYCLDIYAMTELGPVGWGCRERGDGIHLDDTVLSLEVFDPDSERPIAPDELGELVVTTPSDWASPLRKFRTGDLMRVSSGVCACGRTAAWAERGVQGRVTDRMRVRGHVLLPSQIEQVVRRHPAVVDFHVRTYREEVAVQLEATEVIASEGDRARVAAEVAEDLRRSLGIRLQCDVLPATEVATGQDAGRRAQRLTRQ